MTDDSDRDGTKAERTPKVGDEIEDPIRQRWSPRTFSNKPVECRDLRALLEAARWAPSSFNEQPWRFIVADDPESETHSRVAEMLTEHNRDWAADAPVLMLTFARRRFERNDRPNPHARHDVGQAVAQMSIEAVSRGIFVHQMAGIREDAILEAFDIPDIFEPVTGLAIGYPPDDDGTGGARQPDRQRHSIQEIAFDGRWGTPWTET